jgi:WD40 repeat protein
VAVNVSSDKKFICVCVRRASERWKATVLVYDMESQRTYPKAPRYLTHEDGGQHQEYAFTNAQFSEDSKYVACYGNRVHVGVIIYDWRVERIVSTIQTKNVVSTVSFNPTNSTRLCVGGACGMFQFWHFTSKSVYSAPITGFNRTDVTYTTHTWMEPDAVVTGTDRGTLHLVVGCEAKSFHHAFGINAGSRASGVIVPVNFIISKGSTIVAASADGCVCVSRYTRLEGRGGITSIKLEAFFTLQDMDTLTGITWADRNVESTSFAATSANCMNMFQLPLVDIYSRGPTSTGDGVPASPAEHSSVVANMSRCSLLKYRDGVRDVEDDVIMEDPDAPRPASKLDNRVSFHRATSSGAERSVTSLRIRARWPFLMAQRVITCFHSDEIKSLCSNPRSSMFASLSTKDSTVRIWDYNRVNESNIISEDFSQRQNELPNFLDMHPSGLSLAAGSDDYVTEYAITDCKLEVLKRIPVKVAITSPNGEPVMNTSPVSIVKFSNGGHLLAVVTGRLAQIFEVYNYSYNTEKNGVPDRLMTLNDHMANITDICFTRDDKNVYTCGADGAVYEWTVDRNAASRDNDYVMKNVGATRVAVSPSRSCILASFEVESTIRPSHPSRLNSMKSFSRQNSDADHTITHSPSATERRAGLMLSRENSSHQPVAQLLLNRTSSLGSEAPLSGRGGASTSSRAFLVYWTGGKIESTKETVLELAHPVTAISFGMLDGRDMKEICVMGLANGDVVISLLPLPLKVVSDMHIDPSCDVRYMTIGSDSRDPQTPTKRSGRLMPVESGDVPDNADRAATPGAVATPGDSTPLPGNDEMTAAQEVANVAHTYDEKLCRVFSLHEGAVTRTFVSASGLWIFSAGVDGSIFMLNTNLKAKEQVEVSEAYGHENHIVLTDKAMLKSQQSRIEDKDAMLEEMAKEKKHTVLQLEAQRESEKKVLEETMIREIAKRDDIILVGRTELQQANKKAAEKLEHTHKQYRTQLAELEVMYEKKLAHESLYLENMKQAYDEYVTHARMDLESFHRKAGIREERLNLEKEDILEETEKQKKLLLEYCDYVGQRHREVLHNLSEAHDDQKYQMNMELQKQTGVIEAIRNQTRQDEAKALRQMQMLRSEMSAKELEALNTAQELDRMKDRSHRLETALQNALDEIGRKTEAANKWEFKAGEQQQQLSELERVRKALVSQLHSLREEMGPKEMQIVKTTERLGEVDKEYERSLKSISEKEQKLTQSSNMVHLLHKQVRELRSAVIQKEGSLKRAAKLLDEFKYALQQARFESRKITVAGGVAGLTNRDRVEDTSMFSADGFPHMPQKKASSKKGEVLELISSTPVMEESLQRLHDVLNPHATDEVRIYYLYFVFVILIAILGCAGGD